MKRLAILVLFLLGFVLSNAQSDGVRIAWDHSSMQKMAPKGGYPRLLRLKDNSIFFIYQDYVGNIEYKRSYDNGNTWSEPIQVFSQFVYSNLGGENTVVYMANPEIYQLQNNDLIIGCNYRPAKAEIAPFSIVIRRSTDNGKTWLPPQVVYNAAPRFHDGCWEPSFLQLPDGELQVYFANENPYQHSDEQEISMVWSHDNGQTWSETPKTVSFRKDRRDGMPVTTIVGNEIIMVIEDNKADRFKPYTVRTTLSDNWKDPVLGNSVNRKYALMKQIDDSVYMGAPYILKLPGGETLISYQSNENRSSDWELSTMGVAIGNKTACHFKFRTQPFDVPWDREAKWNSLAIWDANTVVAVASTNFDRGNIAPWFIKGYIIPELEITKKEITEYPVFIGSKGKTSARLGLGINQENIYIEAKVKDKDLFSSDGMYVYLATKNNEYKIGSDYTGKTTIWKRNKKQWKQLSSAQIEVAVTKSADGYMVKFSIPFKILSGFDRKTIAFTAALSAYETEQEGYMEFIANTEEQSKDTWLKVEFNK